MRNIPLGTGEHPGQEYSNQGTMNGMLMDEGTKIE
jgi:hypothetical protein